MNAAGAPLNRIEPFDSDKHDRAAFSCGTDQVDNYFKRTANKLVKADNVRLRVMVSPDDDVIGFYAINSHCVDYSDLPKKYARTRPGHGSIPAAYISMMGVDQRSARKGFGGDLLIDALTRIAGVADEVGIAVIMLDVLDCGDPELVAKRIKFYVEYGFAPLQSDVFHLYLPIATARALSE